MIYFGQITKSDDLIMGDKTINKIVSDAKLEISHQIDKYIANIQKVTSKLNEFISNTHCN